MNFIKTIAPYVAPIIPAYLTYNFFKDQDPNNLILVVYALVVMFGLYWLFEKIINKITNS